MGKYTSHTNSQVDIDIDKQMKIIVDETLQVYGEDNTIILAGSFGRGEGSIHFNSQKIAVPLNDYDIYVVTNHKTNPLETVRLEQRILSRLSEATSTDLVKEKFVVGIESIPVAGLARLLPDISAYEMKAASQVLYGPDIRYQIPVTAETIAFASGAITLYHRDIALLENVEPEYLDAKHYPAEARLETIRETCKVYTEICTSLSLLGHFYQPSYRERARLFKENFSKFPELTEKIPNLDEKIITRTEMKLTSDFSTLLDRAYEMWIEARKDLGICQRYFLTKIFHMNDQAESPWSDFLKQLGSRIRSKFFHEYLVFYLRTKHLHRFVPLTIANSLFQIYDSMSYRKILEDSNLKPNIAILSTTSPLTNIYIGTMACLFSLDDTGRVDLSLLELAESYADKIFVRKSHGDSAKARWKRVRDDMLQVQKTYFVREQKRGV